MITNKMLLSMAILCMLLSACGEGNTTAVTDTAMEELKTDAVTEETAPYHLPGMDYQGEQFVMMVGETYNECLVSGETGDVLDDAKWKMERAVEEALNVAISQEITDFWTMPNTVNQYIMSGETTYDSIAMMDRYALTAAMQNSFVPIGEVDTIHTNAVYWGGELSSLLTIGGNQYFAIGSHNLESFRKTACILWNTNIAGSLDIEIPYEDVFAGTWTYEDFMSYKGTANSDVNGDGIMDNADQYTYSSTHVAGTVSQMWQASGIHVISKDNEDMPHIEVWDDQKYFDLMESLYGLLYSGENQFSKLMLTSTEMCLDTMFFEGRSMIHTAIFGTIGNSRDMEDDFAVLPMPKYDETQKNYYSRTYDATFFMVPVSQDDVSFSGAVLDALSCVAYYDLLPVYVDTVLKDKASRDENSKKSIQICFDNRTLDMAESFMFDYFGDTAVYKGIMKSTGMNLSSYLEKNRKRIDALLENICETFAAIQ